MNFTILNPTTNKLANSDIVDGDFGGRREYTTNSNESDYTSRTKSYYDKKENPDDVIKDIDNLSNTKTRKREFDRRRETSDYQLNNEADFMTQSDSNHRAKMDVQDDVVQIPNNIPPKRHRKPNPFSFDLESVYEGEVS